MIKEKVDSLNKLIRQQKLKQLINLKVYYLIL